MKIIVTHKSPDLDAIGSAWLIRRFLPGWEDAKIEYVSAGERIEGSTNTTDVIEVINEAEIIHVDTGLGPLDHHQTQDMDTCGASLTLEYVLKSSDSSLNRHDTKRDAVKRIVDLIIDDDHFQEFYNSNPDSDIYDLSLRGILSGYKLMYQGLDEKITDRILETLDSLLHTFEAKIWAEKEIKEKGLEFTTRWGRALGIETINDAVLKLAQLQGYNVVVRKDPENQVVRIKAIPNKRIKDERLEINEENNIDLTPVYEKIKEMDSESSWFLHISKKMLLNGSSKNPDMKGSKLSLDQVIEILKSV